MTDEVLAAADVVIRMGCGDSCPVLPEKRYADWAIADPAGQTVERIRAIRDDVDQHVRELVAELVPTDA